MQQHSSPRWVRPKPDGGTIAPPSARLVGLDWADVAIDDCQQRVEFKWLGEDAVYACRLEFVEEFGSGVGGYRNDWDGVARRP